MNRTITREGKTFDAGLTVQANLDSPAYGFGYQYGIIRRKRGHLGLGFRVNLGDALAHSTLWAGLDWKFTHKNHIYVFGSREQRRQSISTGSGADASARAS